MSTEAQQKHIMALWGDARRVLRQRGLSPKDADARRKQLHAEAGAVYPSNHALAGQPKSSKDLNNDEFDRVKGKFLAIIRPNDAQAQIDQVNQPAKRAAHSAEAQAMLDIIGVAENDRVAYLDGICRQIAGVALMDMPARAWWKVMAALKRTAKFKSPDKQWPAHGLGDGRVPPVDAPAALLGGKPAIILAELDAQSDAQDEARDGAEESGAVYHHPVDEDQPF